MDLGRAGFERLFGVEHEGQRLVLHVDEPRSFFGDVAVNGCDGGHRVAGEAHRVIEKVAPVARIAGGPYYRAILVGDDGFDTRQREGARTGDAADSRVRMRAAQDARVEHSRKAEIAGVNGGPGYALDGVDARLGAADGFERGHAFLRARAEA
jgi:hypothetical protein